MASELRLAALDLVPARTPLAPGDGVSSVRSFGGPAVEAGPSDEDLMALVRGGDEAAFGMLLKRHERPIIGFLAKMLRNRESARDGAQEVFVRIHGRAHLYEPAFPFRCWLYRIATNVAIDMVRREKRRGFLLLGDLLGRRGTREDRHDEEDVVGGDSAMADAADALGGLVEDERAALVRAAVATLPSPYRAALVLRDLEELSYEEVASVLGCQVGTVKSRVNRGRNLLRDKLASVLGPVPNAAAGNLS